MKKIFLFLAIASLAITSCRKDDDYTDTTETVSIETQNSYDDAAITQFLKDNYFDARGNIVAFSSSITTDDNEKPLADYSPTTLPSGVVYISRYVPANGKTIVSNDVLRIMQKSNTYVAVKATDGTIKFDSQYSFRNTIDASGSPEVDPAYFYVKNSILTNDTYKDKTRSYFEIEGLQEGLKYFKSTEVSDDANYNMQGVIIVPSRAAFARDDHFAYSSYTFKDRCFVFSFQIYKTSTRTSAQD